MASLSIFRIRKLQLLFKMCNPNTVFHAEMYVTSRKHERNRKLVIQANLSSITLSHLTVFILYLLAVCLIKSLLILVFVTLQICLFVKVIGYFNKFACSFLITSVSGCEAVIFFGCVSLYSCEYCAYFNDVTHFLAQPTVYDLVATCI